MLSINISTLQIRIGKCTLISTSQQSFAVEFQTNDKFSSLSQLRKINNNQIQFNTTLRISISKQMIEQQLLQGELILYEINTNRQKIKYASGKININKQNNSGFKFHNLFDQNNNQLKAKIQVSVIIGEFHLLGVKSEIIQFGTSSFDNFYDQLAKSRGLESIINQSQADYNDNLVRSQINQIQNQHMEISVLSPVINKKKNVRNKIPKIKRPENICQLSKDQIIQKYQTTISQLQRTLNEKQQWGANIKGLVQQLEAENQLLKEIRIEQLAEQEINNVEQGIQEISKIVHSRFQASKSNNGESRVSHQDRIQSIKEINDQNKEEENQNRSLRSTKSLKSIPAYQEAEQPQTQEQQRNITEKDNLQRQQSKNQLQNCLNIISGASHHRITSYQDSSLARISELQEQLFKQKQQKQQLQQVAQHMYNQLARFKEQRSDLIEEIHNLKNERQQLNKYIQNVQQQNKKIKYQNLLYLKLNTADYSQTLKQENENLSQRLKEYERQVKESVKAMEEFRNDALVAKEELIMREEEINAYRNRLGDGNNSGVFNASSVNSEKQSSQSICISFMNLYQNTLSQRKQLHSKILQSLDSFSKSNNNISNSKTISLTSSDTKLKLRRLQNKVNRLFLEIIKNKSSLKNINEIEAVKRQITSQIQQILN